MHQLIGGNALGDLPVAKRLSDTIWASHSDASKALNCGYEKIRMVLELFTENMDETAKARQEARGILSKLNTLEYCILLVLWSVVMGRFHQTSIKLQSTSMDMYEAVKLLRSLNNYVASLRNAFEERGKIKIGLENEPVHK